MDSCLGGRSLIVPSGYDYEDGDRRPSGYLCGTVDIDVLFDQQQAPEPQSSQEVVTAGAFDETATPAVVPSSSAPVPSGSSASSAVKAASSAAPERCDCSCLCPMAAFPMAAYQMAPNTTQAIATSSTQMSTFTTVVTTPVGNLIVVSSVGEPALSSDVKATESTPSTSSTSMDQTMSASTTTPSTSQITTPPTSVSGVLPTEIVTDPGTGNAQVQQKNVLDAPLDIDNYSLMTSVNLPVIVGRAAEPTAAV
ncbi:MAG: hypothetical protein LQ337_002409 [Flavoplaca oasis]|nr:MAG: hypothetical protein LQ337_002409 [Flavoplaca oasis]